MAIHISSVLYISAEIIIDKKKTYIHVHTYSSATEFIILLLVDQVTSSKVAGTSPSLRGMASRTAEAYTSDMTFLYIVHTYKLWQDSYPT